jgi:hypothetical protein
MQNHQLVTLLKKQRRETEVLVVTVPPAHVSAQTGRLRGLLPATCNQMALFSLWKTTPNVGYSGEGGHRHTVGDLLDALADRPPEATLGLPGHPNHPADRTVWRDLAAVFSFQRYVVLSPWANADPTGQHVKELEAYRSPDATKS